MTDTVMCYRKLCRSKGENHMKQKYGIVSLVITATAWVVGILCLIVVGMKSDSSEISSGIVNLFVSGGGRDSGGTQPGCNRFGSTVYYEKTEVPRAGSYWNNPGVALCFMGCLVGD